MSYIDPQVKIACFKARVNETHVQAFALLGHGTTDAMSMAEWQAEIDAVKEAYRMGEFDTCTQIAESYGLDVTALKEME